MCSVVGYIGKNLSRQFIIEGLSRLEYRGYDSAGFACLDVTSKRIASVKAAGCISNLSASLEQSAYNGFLGLGHTRWATHGAQSLENAHPHFDCEQTVAVVHNGIIENHHQLRMQLEAEGHQFVSQTDTEVIAHLLEQALAIHADYKDAFFSVAGRLEGAYACIVLMQTQPNTLVVIRRRSPVCIGVGAQEMFIASDVLAFAQHTQSVLYMPDDTIAFVSGNAIALYTFAGVPVAHEPQTITADWATQSADGHAHFMLKEIYEQKRAIGNTVAHLNSLHDDIWDAIAIADAQSIKRVKLVGCGTSWHAGRIGQFFFEMVAKIPTHVYLASEFRYMPFFPENDCLYMGLSQSGETADTLEALNLVQQHQRPVVALTNVASSTMARQADGYLLTQAGPEVAVASTKAFSTQVASLYWLAHRIAHAQGTITDTQMARAVEDLLMTATILEEVIELYKKDITTIHAPIYAQYKRAIFIGRHISYPFALESALKLKEVAYIFSQCYPAGELKHGPLALVDQDIPLFVFSVQDQLLYQKLLSNVQVARARGGHIVSFAFEGQHELAQLSDVCFIIPQVPPLLGPLAMTGIMQFFVYSIARELDLSIDKPRNLAKSVTVE